MLSASSLAPHLASIEEGLQKNRGRRAINLLLLSTCVQAAFPKHETRLHRRPSLVDEFNRTARRLLDGASELSNPLLGAPAAPIHVPRQADDDASYLLPGHKSPNGPEGPRARLGGDGRARMCKEPQLVCDSHPDPNFSVVEAENSFLAHPSAPRSLACAPQRQRALDRMAGALHKPVRAAFFRASPRQFMKYRAVKGMNDILPEEARRFQLIESAFRAEVERAGYRELRTPIVEELALFHKSTGETSEVVQKQMFVLDREREKLALRPEGTPSAARVYIGQSQWAKEPITKWYYIGPMFRAEQPQRGRYRQFHQAGCELYGDPGPVCDAELIDLLYRLTQGLGLSGISIQVNSLGGTEAREAYRLRLQEYFEPKKSALSEHAQARLLDNPLRILDSKDPRDREASEGAPILLDSLTEEDRAHFDGLCRALDALGTPYRIDPRLVRGLDYYTRTCFELTADSGEIGSQNAILGGGRYDGMIASLGGENVPAIGFAMGLERLLLALGSEPVPEPPLCFFAPLGAEAARVALGLTAALRSRGAHVELDGREASLKSKLRRAGSMNARVAIVLGESELARGVAQVKNMAAHEQLEVRLEELVERVHGLLAAEGQH